MFLLIKEQANHSENIEEYFSEKSLTFRKKWLTAFKNVCPIYLAMHLVFVMLTLFAPLHTLLVDFGTNALSLHTLITEWYRWDSGHYATIASQGYRAVFQTAFFPLFPLLERIGVGTHITHNPFIAGLAISNLADLGMLMVLYQIIKEDFDEHQALRTVLCLSVFPSAFFFASAYTESLFLLLVMLSFYQIRHGHFWVAGLFGFFACLTRSAGIFLFFPFAYEYLQRKQLRIDILAIALPFTGIGVYCGYCFIKFKDALAWDHAQSVWHHQFHWPWDSLLLTFQAINEGPGLLSFQTLHNILDLCSVLFALGMIVLMIIGPYRLSRDRIIYAVYGVPLLLFLLSVPIIGDHPVPMQSMPRYMLEVFPVFVVVADLGKHRWFHESYLLISGSLLFLSCTLFLVGHWMI
jgi:Gpi18-like mannosyltransferase